MALKHPASAIHGTKYITKNGWTRNKLELITGDKLDIIRQMHICKKCETTILPSLQCLKIPYDEDVLRKTENNVYKMTLLDAVTGYAFKEGVRENKQSKMIESLIVIFEWQLV